MTGKTMGVRALQNVKNQIHKIELNEITEDFVKRMAVVQSKDIDPKQMD